MKKFMWEVRTFMLFVTGMMMMHTTDGKTFFGSLSVNMGWIMMLIAVVFAVKLLFMKDDDDETN